MSTQQLRWGILSTANIGRSSVIPAIQHSRNGIVAAVASRDLAKAQAFADQLGIPQVYGSYEELLAADDIDAIYIPLPNSMHREWTIKAAIAGKHILCEKPLGLNAAECDEMAAAAEQAGVLLMEAFMYRFHPQTELVREQIANGAIGELRMIKSAFTFRLTNPTNIRLSADLGGGALMDVGCYCVNVSRTLAGSEPVEAQAYAIWADSGVDGQIVGTLRWANGMLAQFDAALTLERRESYQAAGVDGYIDVPAAFVLRNDRAYSFTIHKGRQSEIIHSTEPAGEYQLMVEHFGDCVLDGMPLRYPPAEAAANMRAIEALYRSARNGGQPETIR
jgi:predicted dehydrogenase